MEPPLEYINPTNIYKKFIIIMNILPEISIIFFVLPYFEKLLNIILNIALFLIDLLLIVILLCKDSGYKKNNLIYDDISDINISKNDDYPLLKLVEKNIDIKQYCPKCYIPDSFNINHCFICDKCVEGFSHHCFWLNFCIGKNNIFFYFLFIFFSLIFAYHSIFKCIYSLFDFVNMPYEKLIFISFFKNGKDRELRVLFSALVSIFALIISFPLNLNLQDEMIKLESRKNEKNNTVFCLVLPLF